MIIKRGIVCLLIIIICTSCTSKIDFVEDGPFVEMRLYSASAEYYLDHFPKVITVENDGTIRIFTEEMIDDFGEVEVDVEGAPTVEKKLGALEIEDLKETIETNKFLSLPKDVTDYRVMDGSGSKITIYTTNEEKTVGGENSDNEKYNNIQRAIMEHVREEYNSWLEETREYIYELNED